MMKHMCKFELQVSWTMATTVEIEANSQQEAVNYALTKMRRPEEGEYVGSSMNVDSIEEISPPLLRVK